MVSLVRTNFTNEYYLGDFVSPAGIAVALKVGEPAVRTHAHCCSECTARQREAVAPDALAAEIESVFGEQAKTGYLLLSELKVSIADPWSVGTSEWDNWDVTVTRRSGETAMYQHTTYGRQLVPEWALLPLLHQPEALQALFPQATDLENVMAFVDVYALKS